MRIALEDRESLENLKVLERVRGESATDLVRLALRWAAQRVTAEEMDAVGKFQREQDEDGPDMMELQGVFEVEGLLGDSDLRNDKEAQ